MKTTTRKVTALPYVLGLGLALPLFCGMLALPVLAQPDLNAPKMGENPPNRKAGRNRAARAQKRNKTQNVARQLARVLQRDLEAAELAAGKPLTDEQKQKVRDLAKERESIMRTAREKYVADLAVALAVEPDELRMKLQQALRRGRNLAAAPDAAQAVAPAPIMDTPAADAPTTAAPETR